MSWGDRQMDYLDAALRAVLSRSGVPLADQSSVLHWLASEVDNDAVANDTVMENEAEPGADNQVAQQR